MAAPSNYEQELLELVNRARLNPSGEFDQLITNASNGTGASANITDALDYFGVDLNAFRAQLAGTNATAPLAWNDALEQAATGHSQQVILHDQQSHQLPGEPGLGDRARNAGYTDLLRVGENVYAYGMEAIYTHAGFFIDWGYDAEDIGNGTLLSDWRSRGDGIQDPPGHRNTMLDSRYSEIGIAALADNNPDTQVGPMVVTQNLGSRSGYQPQLVGVIFEDGDGDDFYDAGEGRGSVTISASGSAGTFSTTSWASGGYQMVLPAGSYTVTFSAGGSFTPVTHSVTIGGSNIKLDLDTSDLAPGPSAMIGTAGPDWMTARNAGHAINGLGGSDMVSFVNIDDRMTIDLSTGTASGAGQDWTLSDIENVTGSVHGDTITGDDGDNRIRGLGDYDWLVGSEGADR
ncbi:MAG: CAP domain-containing protein, partial [Pseudorhodobacter sp.]